MAKKDINYYQIFIGMAEDGIKASRQLEKTIKNYNPQKLEKLSKEMHEIEHAADEKKHLLMESLITEFITPIEREDIVQLASELDDVVDFIEECLQFFYMFNIQSMHKHAEDFVDMVVRSTQALKACFDELEHFSRSETIRGKLIEVNLLEELADELYLNAIHELYLKEKDPIKVMAWTNIYDKLERTCDLCEHVAGTIEQVILKNS